MRAYVPFRRNRTLAIVLALFTGIVGGHKFYLGRPGWGLVYLLLCWTYVPAVVGLLEAIGYIFLEDWDFDNRYNDHLPPLDYPIILSPHQSHPRQRHQP